MKTVVIGGGRGCRSILALAAGAYLKELELDVIAVVDENPDAPGIAYARDSGITTLDSVAEALNMPGIELVIELTGSDSVVRDLYGIIPSNVKFIDHTVARIFWDLMNAREEIKKQFNELQQLERNFESFINSANDWISIKDLEGRYVVVNPATARSFNLKAEDFIGRNSSEVLPERLVDIINLHDSEVKTSKQHHTYDEVYQIEGQDHHFQTVRFPLTDIQGEMTGVCTIARDITNEIRLQEQLVKSEKLAALGKLAAGVAHEINNPLTGILAYAEGLLDDSGDRQQREDDVKVIILETLRCRDIVRNLLDFARADAPNLQASDVNNLVVKALSLIQRLPQFRDVIIRRELPQHLPAVEADSQQIQQVLLNLTLNAAEAMNYRGILTISTEHDARSNTCIISVADTGPGIPENLIDKIFEPFFSTKGTNGLGLAVSWGIVERHRGTIEIDMAETGGAVFRVILPVAR